MDLTGVSHGELRKRNTVALGTVLTRALRSANVAANSQSPADVPVPVFPAAERRRETAASQATCPPLPAALEAMDRTGRDPSTAKQTRKEFSHYTLKVDGLTQGRRPPPDPEHDVLLCSPATANMRVRKPRLQSPAGNDIDTHAMTVWNAALRSTGISSTIGMLAHHLKALVARTDGPMGERHNAALEAIGAGPFQRALDTPEGMAFAREVSDVADHIYHLAMTATYEYAIQLISSAQIRRLLWLNAMGIRGRDSYTPWLERPVTLSGPGLFDASIEMMDGLRRQQEFQLDTAAVLDPATPGSSGCTAEQTPETVRPRGPGRPRKSRKKE